MGHFVVKTSRKVCFYTGFLGTIIAIVGFCMFLYLRDEEPHSAQEENGIDSDLVGKNGDEAAPESIFGESQRLDMAKSIVQSEVYQRLAKEFQNLAEVGWINYWMDREVNGGIIKKESTDEEIVKLDYKSTVQIIDFDKKMPNGTISGRIVDSGIGFRGRSKLKRLRMSAGIKNIYWTTVTGEDGNPRDMIAAVFQSNKNTTVNMVVYFDVSKLAENGD